MPLVFPITGRSADGPLVGLPAWRFDPVAKSGSRGTRADQGVCPTIFALYSYPLQLLSARSDLTGQYRRRIAAQQLLITAYTRKLCCKGGGFVKRLKVK